MESSALWYLPAESFHPAEPAPIGTAAEITKQFRVMTTTNFSSKNKAAANNIFSGGGETGARMKAIDWSRTPLGPVESWSQALRTSLGICLNSHFPMVIWWGRELVPLYNDAARSILGIETDPIALGNRGELVCGENRDALGPVLIRILDSGEATSIENELFLINRAGFTEEAHFSWSFSPVRDDDGSIGGIFAAVEETTPRVIGERRRQTLRALSECSSAGAQTAEEACRAVSRTLNENPADFPFALIYLLDEDGRTARLGATIRTAKGTKAAPGEIVVGGPNDPWDLKRAQNAKRPIEIDGLDRKFGALTAGKWTDDAAKRALVVPLAQAGTPDLPAGFLIFGLGPRLPFDSDYRSFLELAAGHAATAIGNARSLRAERTRVDSAIESSEIRRTGGTESAEILAMFESVSDPFFALDRNFCFYYLNSTAERYFGKNREHLIERNIFEIFSDAPITELKTAFERAFHENIPVELQIPSPLSHGSIEVRAYPWRERLCVYFHELNERNSIERRMSWQNRILEAIAIGLPLDEILHLMTAALEAQLDGAAASVLLANDAGTRLFCGSARSFPAEYNAAIDGMEIGEVAGSCGTAAFRREPVVIADIANDPLWARFRDLAISHDLRACWSHPIISPAGTLYGTFAAYFRSPRAPRPFDLELLDSAARIAGIAIEHARNVSALRKSEEFHATISELSSDWAYTARVESGGAVVTEAVSEGFTKLFGYTADELMNAGGWDTIVHPDDLAQAQKQMEKLLSGEVISGEMRHFTKDGDVLWLQYQTRPVTDENGRVVRIYGAATNITEQKNAEARILNLNRELEHRLEEQKTLLELLPVGVCIAQDRDLKYLYANRYLSELTALEPGNVSAYNLEVKATKEWIYHHEGREIGQDELPMFLAVKTEKPVVDYEFDILLPGREKAITLVANTAPLFDEHGRVRGAIGGFLNITERKQIEQALAATAASLFSERERLNIALRTGALGVYEWRVGEDLIWWSPEIYPLYGVDPQSFIPTVHNFNALIHPDDRDDLWKKSWESIERRETFTYEYRIIWPDGTIRWINNWSQIGLDDAGRVNRITGVAADITERKEYEEALQKSEAEFRQLANAVPQFVWVSDPSGRTIYVNHQWTEFSGLGIEETRQPNLMASIYHPGDRERVLTAWKKSVETGVTFEVEARLRNHRNGEYRWFLMRSEPARDNTGKILKWFGTSTDITVRKENENRARLLAAISELSRKFDDPNNLLFEVSRAVGEHFEVRRCLFNEIDIDNDLEIVHRDYCSGVESVAGKHRISVYSSFTSAEMANGRTVVNYDSQADVRTAPFYERIYGPTGERAYVAVPLLRENRWVASLWISDDKPRQWRRSEVSLIEFIAEQVWAVVEKLRVDIYLRESEARFRNMADHAPVMIWVTDEAASCTYISQSWYEFTGQSPDEGLGDGWLDVIHPDDRSRAEQEFRQSNARHNPFRIEYRIRNRYGEFRWAIISARPRFAANDEFLGYIGSVIDITDRKVDEQEREKLLEQEKILREDAEKANRLKDEFLATVSHELRTPLNAILGWATMAQRSPDDPATILRALEVIERSARNQNQIISDILDVSRIITGKLHLNLSPLRLSWVIQAALDSLSPTTAAKRIEISLSIGPGPERVYSGDPDRLQQIFWNLVSNAVKFTPEGGKIDVTLRYNRNSAEIVVSDTGEGIEPTFLPFVFDRFRQADGKKNRKHGGLGLGLAVVRHLTELHGGEVFAESEGKGKGTTFRVFLPSADEAPDREPAKSSPVETLDGHAGRATKYSGRTKSRLKGIRILVVDDEADARDLVEYILANEGAETMTAGSAADALGLLGERLPDLLISDIGMPVTDGFELIKIVREMENLESRQVPALALTAYAGEQDSRRALQLGFDAYLPKPLEPNELVKTVMSLTRKGRNSGKKAT